MHHRVLQPSELYGRLAELSGDGVLTAILGWLSEAQRQGDTAAWVTSPGSCFYPPDAERAGVDLDSLAVVRVENVLMAARSADLLVRSGGFGFVVLDLFERCTRGFPVAFQSRLAALARHHDAAICVLTDKPPESASLGPLVGLRLLAKRGQPLHILKDRRGASWRPPTKGKRRVDDPAVV